jgi:tRNA threonylcarbamoyladenosine biosynthesis protein TsaB
VLVLCIDTATPQVAVAIGSDAEVLGHIQLSRCSGGPRHAEQLAPAIEYLCTEVGVSLDQLAAVGVGIGPGLFTGLRVGVTTAKVIASALRIPIIAVPSLDLLAFELRFTNRLIVPIVDARRSEVYYAIYRAVPGGVQRISPYEVGDPNDIAGELSARGQDALLVGDGALLYRERFYDVEKIDFGSPGLAYPSAAALVELASAKYQREEFVPPSDVSPMYLRKSDAEINWENRGR